MQRRLWARLQLNLSPAVPPGRPQSSLPISAALGSGVRDREGLLCVTHSHPWGLSYCAPAPRGCPWNWTGYFLRVGQVKVWGSAGRPSEMGSPPSLCNQSPN